MNYNISKPVKQYSLDNIFIKEFDSISEASRYTGDHSVDIKLCCKEKKKSAKRYIWKYSCRIIHDLNR